MNNRSELVSIIMPAKNASSWIEECLESVIKQSYDSWELIVVNDHSADHTTEILEEYSKKDGRIKHYNNNGNGIIDALNMALQLSSGEWITRMDADDIMPANKLETLISALSWNKNAVASGKVKYFSDQPVSDGYKNYETWLNKRIDRNDYWDWMYRECVISSANWLTHRNNVEFEENVYPEDYALAFHWYNRGISILGADAITHLWREHIERTSRNSKDYQQEAFFKLKINQFFKITRDNNRPLAVMGNNQKSKLTIDCIESHGSAFDHIQLENISKLKALGSPQVLIAVFPEANERAKIQSLMEELHLKMGIDWWWL
ncbi:glycosyltransferase [Salibacteraceae bacterium]|nr:glycosyltransferase [Salibacteraceae bacterium]